MSEILKSHRDHFLQIADHRICDMCHGEGEILRSDVRDIIRDYATKERSAQIRCPKCHRRGYIDAPAPRQNESKARSTSVRQSSPSKSPTGDKVLSEADEILESLQTVAETADRATVATPESSVTEGQQEEQWKRLSSWRRRGAGVLSILTMLSVGAALAVLIVYPLLPERAQVNIMRAQEEVAGLAPWTQSR